MEYYGLIGEKLSHSLSPEIHEYIFKNLNIKAAYKLFEVEKEDFFKLKDAFKVLNIRGVNVTIPYKEEIIKLLDEVSIEASKIGAVNTVFNVDGKLKGYNTDYFGFKYMLLDKGITLEDKVVTILGTGGASKAVIQYALDSNAKKIYLVTRDKNKIVNINNNITLIDYNDIKNIVSDVIINTTPVGMYPNVEGCPVSEEVIRNNSVLIDLIYNPYKTEFLKLGEKLKKTTCGGLMMLVGQGIKAEEIWNNISIDSKIAKDIYNTLKEKFI